jgi:tRNA A37 threonylcarbamoyladenosine synthetase subunit TsaC/SUA5/YrdC
MLKPDAEDEYNHDNPSVVIDLTKQELTTIRDGESKTIPFKEL